MRLALRAVAIGLLLTSTAVRDAGAQDFWIAAAVTRDVQRFDEGALDEAVPLRMDGSSTGWIALGGLRVFTRLAATFEWSEPGTITDVRALSLTVNGRPTVITSTFAHTTRSLSGLAGYTHALGARVRLSYLGGLSSTRIQRQFSSDAGGMVLVRPSNLVDAGASTVTDDVLTPILGFDVHVALTSHVRVVSGFRAQPLELTPATTGWSSRAFVGGGWRF
jgi:hypothetical protein